MLNYYQLLATGNWKLATVLCPSIRDTRYAIRYTLYEVRKITYEVINIFCKTKPISKKSS
ncbi:MAG: hypothetical protein WBC22_03680 [Sedimentisphaerales bacterium]